MITASIRKVNIAKRCFNSVNPNARYVSFNIASRLATKHPRCIKVGDQLPAISVYETTPDNPVNIRQLFEGQKGVIFSVPGAFVPGCTQGHFPEYLSHANKFKTEGYNIIACLSVNDPFVMHAWAQIVDPEHKIRMLADMKGEFTTTIGMSLDCTSLLGNIRCRRFSMIIENSYVKHINQEPDHSGLACLLCIETLKTEYKQPLVKKKSYWGKSK